MINYTAEAFGTAMLILFGDGVVANVLLSRSKGESSGWIVITFGWGVAVMGALAGAVLVWLMYLPHWAVTQNADLKLAVFCTGPAIRKLSANLLTETIATAAFVFAVLGIGANAQTLVKPGDIDLSVVFSNGLQPLLVGGLVLGVGLSLGGSTGYAINPARDLGPRIAHFLLPIPGKRDSDWGYAWIPIVGPLVGGVIGAQLFKAVGF